MTRWRDRRLEADHQEMQRVFDRHDHIRVVAVEGTPPEKYTLEFRVRGLAPTEEGQRTCTVHRAEVFLPLDYPRRPPFCRMITPTFHPNIDPQKICIGDHWSAGQSLAPLVVRIGEMLCYQSYNVKSPLNGAAAAWAEANQANLPLDHADLSAGL